MEKILWLFSVKMCLFTKVNYENFWIFGGVNKHLFRKVNLIIRAQFLLCRLHNNDNLKLYESFHRQTLLYYSFFSERWSSNACKIWSSNYLQICLFQGHILLVYCFREGGTLLILFKNHVKKKATKEYNCSFLPNIFLRQAH